MHEEHENMDFKHSHVTYFFLEFNARFAFQTDYFPIILLLLIQPWRNFAKKQDFGHAIIRCGRFLAQRLVL